MGSNFRGGGNRRGDWCLPQSPSIGKRMGAHWSLQGLQCPLRPAAITTCCWWMGNTVWLWPGANVVTVVFSYGKCLRICPCFAAHSCLKIF